MTTYFYYLSAEEIVKTFGSILTYNNLKMYAKDTFNGTYQVEVFYGPISDEYERLIMIRLDNEKVFEDIIIDLGNEFIYHLEQHKPDSVYIDGKLVEESEEEEEDCVENFDD